MTEEIVDSVSSDIVHGTPKMVDFQFSATATDPSLIDEPKFSATNADSEKS